MKDRISTIEQIRQASITARANALLKEQQMAYQNAKIGTGAAGSSSSGGGRLGGYVLAGYVDAGYFGFA
jgi:hypothetical protein